MDFMHLLCIFSISLVSCSYLIKGQQPYIRKATTACDSTDKSNSALGYTCNGATPRCQAYLTFRSQPPFTSVSSISSLLSADPSQLSQLNSVSESATFEINRMVLVPVNCSCSGKYYQVNASYVVQQHDNYFIIANNTFQGLSTCQALKAQNSNLTTENLYSGTRLSVPLRCACPTKNQSNDGVQYLLSYLVTWGQYVALIGDIFGADTGRTLDANSLSEQDTVIYPFTTLLVPLDKPPSSSQILQVPSPPPPPPSSPVPSSHTSSNKTWIYVVAGVLGGLGLLSVIGVIIFCVFFSTSKSKSKKEFDAVVTSESFEALEKSEEKKFVEEFDFLRSVSSSAQSLQIYTFKELDFATEGFGPSSCIKGSVYCGKINGDLAAIKKINGDVSKEINILNKINHFNIIRLSGVCFNDGTWYLVYEYASSGPLCDWIFNNDSSQKFLTWTQRIQIAFDIATGLNYLHCYASPPYVHKDIKSSNILLDSNLRAKIANLSLARSADEDGEHFVLTRHIVGTQGYMAPEYVENGMISPKFDVYSFGVLLMEMLTGKEVSSLYKVNTDLSDALRPTLHEEDGEVNLSSFMDPSLKGTYPADHAIFVIKLIDACIKKDPTVRPEMAVIVQNLSRTTNSSLSWEHSGILE
ncbi:lysM domain receptor-like kinase 4 [Apium graveolens]|uniref:lysM domain receptor-like kinase 4 n=1 Tax=Apium graveolens TaxID=4045 RepID=UPI003D7A2699